MYKKGQTHVQHLAETADSSIQGKHLASAKQKREEEFLECFNSQAPVIMFANVGMDADKGKKVVKVKPFKKHTKKQDALIIAGVKKERRAMLSLPLSSPVSIIPAPKLSKLKKRDLLSMVADLCPRIIAIPEFSDCVPTVSSLVAISTAMTPLVNSGTKNLNNAEKVLLKTLNKQLRQGVTNILASCASLSDGNLPLFALLMINTKRKGVSHDAKLPATRFRLNTKRGRGTVLCTCDVIPYSKNYTVYFGKTAIYDKATWDSQDGSSRILIEDLEPGVLYYFYMVANGKKIQGYWGDPLSTNAPFN